MPPVRPPSGAPPEIPRARPYAVLKMTAPKTDDADRPQIPRGPGYHNTEATTNMTKTNTTKPERVKFNYPFATKAQILASQADFPTCLVHLEQLYAAQTADEQEDQDTKFKNRRGFMSSHAVTGSQLAVKARSGEELTPEEQDKVRGIVCRYGKQLAAFAREAQIAANPDLAAVAAIFSAGPRAA